MGSGHLLPRCSDIRIIGMSVFQVLGRVPNPQRYIMIRKTLLHYEIKSKIGEEGMGVLWRGKVLYLESY